MNHRRNFLAALGVGALAVPLASFAQKPGKVWRIVFLAPNSPESNPGAPDAYSAAFLREMQAAGHALGVDYVVELSSADGDYQRLPALAKELVRLNADIILPVSPIAVSAAHQASKTVPIVCIGAHDPVGLGLAASLARPGGNLTGLATFYADLIPKHLELLKAIVPKASRVAILANAKAMVEDTAVDKAVREAAQLLGMRLQVVTIESADQLPRAFAAMTRARAAGFITIADVIFLRERRQVAELALKHRLPSLFADRESAQAGGLLSYGEDFVEIFAQAAKYVSKIMKGAKPGDLPIEQPTKFHLAINRKTAKALKLTIPQELLLRADEVLG
ncbi:MAG: ABC transporter substrate-binding protein [Rhodocyclaceae bacterium]|nr:MAG: ABC transporter substrate-binding protein [Rhodocyclaceae bacterium]